MTSSDEVPNDNIKLDKSIEKPNKRNSLNKTVVILAVVIAVVIVIEVVLEYRLHGRYKTFLRIAEVVSLWGILQVLRLVMPVTNLHLVFWEKMQKH